MDKKEIAKNVIEATDLNYESIVNSVNAVKAFIQSDNYAIAMKELDYIIRLLDVEKKRSKDLFRELFDQAGYFEGDWAIIGSFFCFRVIYASYYEK